MAGARVRGPPAAQVTPAPGRAGARSGAVHARRRHGPRGPWGDPPLRALLLLILCVACGAAQQPGVRLRVAVRRPGVDSARLEAGATAARGGDDGLRSGAVTIRVGIIGAGFARRVQLPGLRLVPGVEVTAVASGHRANAEATAKEFGIRRVYDDGEQVARAPDVDLVIVSSTPDSHARFAIAALEAGKHVLCEKPTAVSATEAQRMLDASERRPRQIAWVDHEIRYEPNRRKARDLIRAGAIGEGRP